MEYYDDEYLDGSDKDSLQAKWEEEMDHDLYFSDEYTDPVEKKSDQELQHDMEYFENAEYEKKTNNDWIELKDEWLKLDESNSNESRKRQEDIENYFYQLTQRDVFYEEVPQPNLEGFSLKYFRFGNNETHKGKEIENGLNKEEQSLNINSLLLDGSIKHGDKIDLVDYPNIKSIVASSQEQLDMLTPDSKKQISGVTLTNHSTIKWYRYFMPGSESLDHNIDLTDFKNLKHVRLDDYVNKDLENIKFSDGVADLFLKNTRLKQYKAPENIEVFAQNAQIKAYADNNKPNRSRSYPTNKAEALKLCNERIRLAKGIDIDLVDEKGKVHRYYEIAKDYPNLAPKVAAATEKELYGDGSAWKRTELADRFINYTQENGKKLIDESPELALAGYNNMKELDEYINSYVPDFNTCINFVKEHPVLLPALKEQVKKNLDIKKHGSTTLESDAKYDLAVIGAVDSKYAKKVDEILDGAEKNMLRKYVRGKVKASEKQAKNLKEVKADKAAKQKAIQNKKINGRG
jgi:hypothetical protein